MIRRNPIERAWLKWLYGLIAIVAIFTGFGNMPLYGRYYVADVPYLQWTGDFIANVKVHTVAGASLLTLALYFLIVYLLMRSRGVQLTKTGFVQLLFLWLVLLSGVVMAIKNLPGVVFDLPVLMTMNFLHMGSAVLFVLVSLLGFIYRGQWFQRTSMLG